MFQFPHDTMETGGHRSCKGYFKPCWRHVLEGTSARTGHGPPTTDFTHHWAVFTHTNIHTHVHWIYPYHLFHCHKAQHTLGDMECGKVRSYIVQSHQCAQELQDTNWSSSKYTLTLCHPHPDRVHSDGRSYCRPPPREGPCGAAPMSFPIWQHLPCAPWPSACPSKESLWLQAAEQRQQTQR